MIGTFADDTAFLASNNDPKVNGQYKQYNFKLLQEWFSKWEIKLNETKFSYTSFSLRPKYCPST